MSPGPAYGRLGQSIQGLSQRDRRALRIGGTIVLPVVAWLAIVQPYLRAVESLNDRLASEQALLERERALLVSAPRMGSLLKSAAAAMRAWDERLLHAPNSALAEAEVTSILEGLARRNRVLLQEVASTSPPAGTSTPAGLHPVRMTLRGESDYEGILNFLGSLERHELLFHVVGVSLDTTSSARGGPRGTEGQPGAMSFIAIIEAFARLDG